MPIQSLRFYLKGQQSLLIHCAETLLERGHTLHGVITPSEAIRSWARTRGVKLIEAKSGWDDQLNEGCDYFLSITNFTIVPSGVLARAKHGGINFHDGPLPRYAGLNATAWALMHREKAHGITWHRMTDGVDEGDILAQRLFELREDETSYTLNTKCYEAAMESFGELVDQLASDTVSARAQPKGERHYFGRTARPEALASLDFTRPALELEALVRALDFGPVENPLASAKFLLGERIVTVRHAAPSEAPEPRAAGTVLQLTDDGVVVQTGEGALHLGDLRCPLGLPLPVAELERLGLRVGVVLEPLGAPKRALLSAANERVCRHEPFWVERLTQLSTLELPYADRSRPMGRARSRTEHAPPNPGAPEATDNELTVLLTYFAKVAEVPSFDVAYRDAELSGQLEGTEPYFASHVPLRVELPLGEGFAGCQRLLGEELALVRKHKSFAADVVGRYPALAERAALLGNARHRVVVELALSLAEYEPPPGTELAIAIEQGSGRSLWVFDESVLSPAAVMQMQHELETFRAAVLADPSRPLREQPILSKAERQKLVTEFNDTRMDYPRERTLAELFEEQVARTPDAEALVDAVETVTYRELNLRANRLAHHLRARGVGPDVLVGLSVERSASLLVGALGILKAGGAYVPLDPSYPKERLALMLEDSKVKVLVTEQVLAAELPEHAAEVVYLERNLAALAHEPTENPAHTATAQNLVYTIYTSGSTGRPKGVMVEHRNVVNFFAGMDDRLGFDRNKAPGVWLAVTSLSFDISVLELFWTLTRGFKVVLHTDKADDGAARASARRHASKPITFSLMYFASDEGENDSSADKYRLLLEGAKFGDKNGFVAVWTPERHFHAFGGLYPNPSVASAALATITERIALRAASVVMPLHNPIRVAEEWSLVDNLSNGRVGIAFASGWQPNDFVLYKPERFPKRKEAMYEDLDTVRRLWRGEKLTLTSPLGKEIQIQTLPRPVQKELPFWITAAGNPETFRGAGEIGANLLTHLLGQSLEEVREKIAVYRQARKDAGHEGRGSVTLMLHTFVGLDEREVKETVRGPMKEYLRSSVELIKLAAWSFPTFKQKADATGKTPAQVFEEEELSPGDMEAVLDHAFGRYYVTSGLFGTPESCLDIVDKIKGIDVDDIGCLLDYGVPSAKVLAHLKYINQVKDLAIQSEAPATESLDLSLPAQVARQRVTHLQCTPSQMSLILATPEGRHAVGSLELIMIGGEAFPSDLAKDLQSVTKAQILNMYGPTETTVWSATYRLIGDEPSVPIGRPITNTELYVLDKEQEPVPIGMRGELYIAGDGVVRGYFERPELTAERFVADPFSKRPGARMYKTGDLARYRADGVLEFLGRADFQVKLRGYRIELGEIEAVARDTTQVREALAVVREDVAGDKRLVLYLIGAPELDVEALRADLKARLPDYMVPAHVVTLDRFPLTPNNKVDRKALPAPEGVESRSKQVYVEPKGAVAETIAKVFANVLNVKRVGLDDNFFDLGGHSLLTVQAHRTLREQLEAPLSLTDMFRFPTVRSLAAFLDGDAGTPSLDKSKDRAEARKAALSRRADLRDRKRPRA